jgi:hypothetical protein
MEPAGSCLGILVAIEKKYVVKYVIIFNFSLISLNHGKL